MLDLRAPTLPPEQGERLVRDVYRRDFRERNAAIHGRDSWKLERRQYFEEQGSASRDALTRGDWDEALRLIEADREDLVASARDNMKRASIFHRLRVVETPLTPYLQWELHALRLRAECGARIRTLDAGTLEASEADNLLPELVVLGGRTLYEILYTESGVPNGAVRYTDKETVRRWENYIKELYGAGEDVESYFAREVAHLPPPTMNAE
ncbi:MULTISPECIES: DUF6879 family protein [unclassified Streptomyces]|uniref:DUF6879 family protein n=1 Tax=unclassified Streptomyces TaxID=2593676 RepID=UPI00081E8C53|nr:MULTISPECIES: DUF6879 family protein [unclassified Streptomyces]MYZ36615.1 hypothetical protein [Streptomyces sp. SID4917]SCF84889.1 hypothetical protein GA0115259_1035610 [Streptomyces sp. MnatMP-M17]